MSVMVLLVAAWVLGGWIVRPLDLPRGADSRVCRLLIGLSVCGVVIGAVGAYSVSKAQFAINVLAVAGLGYELLTYTKRESGNSWKLNIVSPEFPPDRQSAIRNPQSAIPWSFLEWISVLAIVSASGLALLGALAPVTGWDACVAHLALPKDYAREGRMMPIPGNEYSAYPQLLDGLFTYLYAYEGERAVCVFNWFMAVMACVAAFGLGRRIESRRCGWVAAAMLATAPIFLEQAQAPALDMTFCAFTLAGLACLAAWRQDGNAGWGVAAALIAGSSCGIRHTGYLVCVLLWLGALLAARGHWKFAIFGFPALVVVAAAPWLARSAILTGNPFFPFVASLDGGQTVPHGAIAVSGIYESIRGTSLRQLLMFPWDIVMRPNLFDGWTQSPGGLVLLLGIPGLVVGGARARALGAFSAAGGLCFFFLERLARYLLPFVAPMMIVAAMTTSRMRTLRHGVAAVVAILFGYGLALDAAAVHFKLPVVLGRETREAYLAKHVERYAAFAWLNEHMRPGDTVLTFDRRAYFFSGRSYQNLDAIRPLLGQSARKQMEWFRENKINWVMIPVTFIRQSPKERDAFLELANLWRLDRRHFVPANTLRLTGARSDQFEVVEIYAVNYEP